MRIALFHNLPSGGAKRTIYEWVRHLVSRHTIDVYTLEGANHDFCDIRPYVDKYNIYHFSPRRLFQSPFGRLNQLQRWQDLGDLERINRRIATDINSGGYDVVFANPCSYTVIPTLLQYVRIPSIYYLHEPFGKAFQRTIDRPYIKQSKIKKFLDGVDPLIWLYHHRLNSIQTRSLKKTTLLLANSLFTQQQMKNGYGLDAPICHIGVDSESFHPETGISKENTLISVGELSPRKGFDFLLRSMAHIPLEVRPRLVLACNRIDPDEQAYIRQLADQNQIELQIMSNLDTSELSQQYNRAKLCIYAPVLEPFGLVPLEAMACGTPVVGVCEGGIKETVIDEVTGLLVERDPVRFANAIQFFFENPEIYRDFSQRARTYVTTEWSWSKLTADLEKYLVSVI